MAAVVSVFLAPVAALAAPTPRGGPRPLAVSVPSEPTPVAPGATASIGVRVLNPGDAPVTVTISGGGVQLGDNGHVTIASTPDARWQGLVGFPSGPLTIAAQSYLNTTLTVRMPAQISPDLYFIGFLVTPEATTQGNIKIVNQIGSFVTVDVPGPRVRQLTAGLTLEATLGGGRFVFGSQTEGTVRVRNVGQAQARFWGESDTTSAPGGTPHQQRIDKLLLPVGHTRSFKVTGKPAWPIGFVTIKVHIIYPDATEVATKELVLTKRVLVVNPIVLAVLFAATGATLAWWLRRRRRKQRMPRHTATRGPSSRNPAHGPRHRQSRRPRARSRLAAG